jgi:hypothetical protein
MPIQTLGYKGIKFEIFGWLEDEGDSCQVEDFLLELIANNSTDAASMDRLLQRTADKGLPIGDHTKFRHLRGTGQGLIEFKARKGSRIIGFEDKINRRIICIYGVPKLSDKRFERYLKRAQDAKDSYTLEVIPVEGGNYVQ